MKHYWMFALDTIFCSSTLEESYGCKWRHSYYIKGMPVWDINPQASWVVQKILKAKKTLGDVGYSEAEVSHMAFSSIKSVYKNLRGDFPKVQWKDKLLCNNQSAPK